MMNYHKRMIGLTAFIGIVSAGVIYSTADMGAVESLRVFRPWSVLTALVFLAVGMYFDCTRLITLVKMTERKITLMQSLSVILSNYFLATLTPGATGGAVAQVLVLREFGVPTGEATVLVLVRTILSIGFLICSVPVVLGLDCELSAWVPTELIAVMAVGMIAGLFICLWCVRSRAVKRIVLGCIGRIAKPRRRMIWHLYCDVGTATELLRTAPRQMVRVMIDTALSLLALYAIVPSLFLGLGIETDWITVMGRMILLNLVLYFAPTPGGSGVAEGGFVYLFGAFLPNGTVGILAVAWRVIAEYIPFGLGMYVTLKLLGDRLSKIGKTVR